MFVHRDKDGRIIDVTGSINRTELERLENEEKWVTPRKKASGKVQLDTVDEVPAITEATAQVQPVPEPQEVEPTESESVGSQAPNPHDLKADWVDYAVTQGAEPSEAEGLTKQELIELYGG